MRVLVTGGAGFIGFHLAAAHAAAGDEVIVADNLWKTSGMRDPELEALLAHQNVRLVSADLTVDATPVTAGDPFDVAYHLAAINGTRLFYEIPYELARANLAITMRLLDALALRPPRRIVYASTSEVYADGENIGALRVPTGENAVVVFTQPTNRRFSYGTSKFMGEFLCLRFGERYSVSTTVIRYHNIYGPRMGDKHVVPELTKRILEREDPLRVFGCDETRAFCFVADAVEATRLVARCAASVEIVHIGDPRNEISIRALARQIMAILEIDLPIIEAGRREGSVSRRCPDIALLRRLTGFEPFTSLDTGLRISVESYRHHLGHV